MVEYAGCRDVRARPDRDEIECIYDPGKTTLQLWVTHPRSSEASIFVDDRPVAGMPYWLKHESGQGYHVPLDTHAHEVTVRVPEAEPWALRLQDAGYLGPHYEAQRKAIVGQAKTLQERLRDRADERALDELGQLTDDTLSQGLLSLGLLIAGGTSFFAINNLEKPAFAQQLLENVAEGAGRYPEGDAMLEIYLGRALRMQGRQLDAIIRARRGSQIAMRLDQANLMVDGLTEYSMLLADLGYLEAAAHWRGVALRRGRAEVPEVISPLLEVTALVHLQLAKAGRRREDPKKYYEELLARSAPGGVKPWAPRFGSAHLGLAEVAMLERDPLEALSHLAAIDYARLPTWQHAQARELELHAHLTLGSPSRVIRSRIRALERRTARMLELGARWSAAVRRGHAHEFLGEADDARLAYEASEEFLDTLLPLAALGIGGQAVNARYDEGTQRLMSLLLRGPEPRAQEALCVARQAQARLGRLSLLKLELDGQTKESALSREIENYLGAKRAYEDLRRRASTLPADQLRRATKAARQQQRDIQQLALDLMSRRRDYDVRPRCEDLRAREPGELLLGLYPLGEDLIAFVSDDQGVTHHVLPLGVAVDPPSHHASLAELLFDPIEDRLERATQIRVLAGGDAGALPVHAIPWHDDTPLGLERPVVYGLELPFDSTTLPEVREPRAIVLDHARALGATAAANRAIEELVDLKYHVLHLSTQEPQVYDLRTLLPEIDHFFYAGHAYFTVNETSSDARELWPPYAGGAASEPSYLPLDEVARLEVADILMAGSGPSVVVLMGCATGVTDQRTSYGGQSLASAFIGAGARVAIASTRSVKAEQAFLLGEGLYRHLATLDVEGPGRWMQYGMRWAQDDERWQVTSFADYRVFVP